MVKAERDPIDEALRIVRRRTDLIPTAFLGLILALMVPVWMAAPPALQSAALANFSIIFVFPLALFLVGRLSLRRMRAGFEKIRSDVREVKVSSLRGIVFIMGDGLFVQALGSMTILSMFFNASGEPLVPTADEALRWTRPLRWKRELLVRLRRGEDPAVAGLAKVRESSGATTANALVARYASNALEPNPPARMVSLSLGRAVLGVPPDRIVPTQVSEYLQQLSRTPATAGAAE